MGTKSVVLISLTIISVFTSESSESDVFVTCDLPVTDTQMKELGVSVCDDLPVFEYSTISSCPLNFSNPERSLLAEPNEINIKCQYPNALMFKTRPSDNWQLVILVPAANINVSDPTIHYILIEPYKTQVVLRAPAYNYTVWTTILTDEGIPSLWRRGQDVEVWEETTPSIDAQRYLVDIKYLYKKGSSIDVVVKWDRLDETDQCFYVFNQCQQIKEKYIGPEDPSSLQLQSEGLDTRCVVSLAGKYGITEATYLTPSCQDLPGCETESELEIPANMSVKPYQASEGWDVRVGWAKPKHYPNFYNVTISADEDYHLQVAGNATDVLFKDVMGTGIYSVSIVAVDTVSRRRAHTTRRALFPAREDKSLESLAMVGAWTAVFVFALALVGAAFCSQKLFRKYERPPYYPDLEYKPPKDCEIDLTGSECTMNDDHWEVRADRVLLHEFIGEGAFGVVRRGTITPGGKDVAVKMLKDFPTVEEIRSFHAEMELMKSVGWHPHVAHLVGCCSGRRPLILAEYCSRGDLLTYLRHSWDVIVSKRNAKYYNNNIESTYYKDILKSRNREHSKLVTNKLYDLEGVSDPELSSIDLISFCRQIAKGMEFLASNRVVHRDLAARNILVCGDRTLKIADFGLSRDVYEENQYKQKGNGKMPVKWMALESLTHRIYTSQSDVWSFGVVMWEIVTVGGAPYSEVAASRLPRLLRAGYRMPCPNNCSKQLYELMLSCWHSRPRERPTFTELHQALDGLLNGACADTYLCLELDPQLSQTKNSYYKLFTEKLGWGCAEHYERPFKAPNENHYTSPPASLTRPPQVV